MIRANFFSFNTIQVATQEIQGNSKKKQADRFNKKAYGIALCAAQEQWRSLSTRNNVGLGAETLR